VITIVQRGNRVIITVDNISTFVADAAIITVPRGFQNGNSAISDLGVGIGNKIALHFSTIFWPNVKALGLVAQASYACGYFLNLHKATGHPVLVYMTAGRFAYDIEKLCDEEAVNFVTLQLKKMIPDVTDPV
ncbi:unnamed protein product, partial [Musa acuminata var. zebrina]